MEQKGTNQSAWIISFRLLWFVKSARLTKNLYRWLALKALFGSIIYNLSIVYIRQNFLEIVVHVILIDQLNQIARLYEIQVTVIYSRAILVTVMSECM